MLLERRRFPGRCSCHPFSVLVGIDFTFGSTAHAIYKHVVLILSTRNPTRCTTPSHFGEMGLPPHSHFTMSNMSLPSVQGWNGQDVHDAKADADDCGQLYQQGYTNLSHLSGYARYAHMSRQPGVMSALSIRVSADRNIPPYGQFNRRSPDLTLPRIMLAYCARDLGATEVTTVHV